MISRRAVLRGLLAAGLGGGTGGCGATRLLAWRQPAVAGAPPPEGLHVQFGADGARAMAVSWSTAGSVRGPRLRLGTATGGLGRTVPAETRTYVDAASGIEVYTHHAVLTGLEPATSYVYEVLHDGARPAPGTFRTAPDGRAPFRFTSFGDQGTPAAGDPLGSPWAAYVVDEVEGLDPLFHLLNGDLCYANMSRDRAATWSHFFANNARSARHRPWMPAPGNHENERGNGPHGFGAFQTRFAVPDHGGAPEHRGLWYAFTAGSVRVVALSGDDVCLQDGGDTYVHGFSDGAQVRWLDATLAAARADPAIDWVVVCMHQTAISSANHFNGCDRGIREAFLPLFERHGVDLVVCGHEHHYERSHALRGVDPRSETLRPRAVARDVRVIDTSRGTVHLVLGGGGTSAPSNGLFWDPPEARVIVGVSRPDPTGRRPSVFVREDAREWSAVRDAGCGYGFAAFDVDPGAGPADRTRMRVTYYRTAAGAGRRPEPFEQFVLERPRTC
jgi:3',5'-cyclic AMP phosphodiesterase CpdA